MRKTIKKIKKGNGGVFSKSTKKPSPPKSPPKTKKVRFNDDPVSEIRSQSPRDKDDFYYPATKNKDAINITPLKEKIVKKNNRLKSIVRYQNRQREIDLLDMSLGRIPLKGGKKRTKKFKKKSRRQRKSKRKTRKKY
jgi:hypothetical protein